MARVVQNCVTNTFCERRRFRRLPIAVQIELRVKANTVPIRAKTADISLGGCYVEMALTLAVDTTLKIVLWLGHESLAVDGVVVSCHPQFGNGIEFSGLSQDSQLMLQRFLESSSDSSQKSLPKSRLDI